MSYAYEQRKRPRGQEKAAPVKSADAAQDAVAPAAAQSLHHRVDLPDAMRAKMENAFGADLSAVKLYESQAVADAGAEAVAQGSSIAFAPGRLDFSSFGGQALLGHELSHVVSQARGEVTGGGFLNDHALEARADREGAMAAAGRQVYTGPVTGAMSGASPSPAVAAPMQAKRGGGKKADPDWENLSQASKSGDAKSIKTAYDVIAQKQSENVTEEQFDAVDDYIADSTPINGYLRGNMKLDKIAQRSQKRKIKLIDQAMNKNRLGADVKAYRGVSDVALAALLMQSGDKRLKKAVNKNGSINHEEFAKVKDRLKGVEFSDKGFGSTSVNEKYAERWRKGIIKREAATKVLDEKFQAHRNDPEVQKMIADMTKEKGVKNFGELSNTDQILIKKGVPLADWREDDEWDAREEELQKGMGSHMYEINAPKGAKATMIDRMRKDAEGKKGNAGQQEMLVGRNARYKITDILPILDEQGVVQQNQYRIIMDLLNE